MSKEEKVLYKMIGIAFVVILLPMVIISIYNVPCTDDYGNGILVHNLIKENGFQIIGIIKCAFQNMLNSYFNWQGRYSEAFLVAFMPENFHLYWLSAIVMIGFFIFGIWYLLHSAVNSLAGAGYSEIANVFSVFIILTITQNLPSAVEGFYWFVGAVSYMMHHTFYLIMCAFAVQYLCSPPKMFSAKRMCAWIFFTILAAGGNNVTSFISVLTYCVFLAIAFLLKNKKWMLLPSVVSVVGFLISYLAPGNLIRGGSRDSYHSILWTIIKCFRWTLRQYLLDWTTAAILFMILILLPFFAKLVLAIKQRHTFRFPLPGLLAAGSVCFLSAMSSPPFYVLGENGPLRLHNVIYINYVLLIFMNAVYFLGWLSIKYIGESQMKKLSELYSLCPLKYSICLFAACIFCLCVGDDKTYGTSIEAAKELATGQAAQYHREAMERKELYLDETMADVVVEPFSALPSIIFSDDITDRAENWKNQIVSQFYDKESVALSEHADYIDYN